MEILSPGKNLTVDLATLVDRVVSLLLGWEKTELWLSWSRLDIHEYPCMEV